MTAIAIVAIALAAWSSLRARRRIRRFRRPVRQLESRIAELEADLCHAKADRDRISAELNDAYMAGAALVDRYWRAERRAARHLVRSLKRRAAIVRIVRHCRKLRDDLDVADVVGAELAGALHEQATGYDAAIEALTRRVAELMPGREVSASACAALDAFLDEELSNDHADAFRCHLATCERCQRVLDGRMQEHVAVSRSRCEDRIAFVDGELSADRAAAFRVHLRGCAACGAKLTEDAGLAARLSTLEPETTGKEGA